MFLILMCFVQTATCWDLLPPGVSKSPHHLCRFVPLGRSSSDHWCFSCCLPGGEWRKGPVAGTSDMGMTGTDTGNPDTFLCVEMKRSGEWTHSTVFWIGKNLQQKKWDLKRDKLVLQISSFFELGARVQLCLCPSWPKRIPTVGCVTSPDFSPP